MYDVICDTSNREHWLEERRNGIGGSDAPSILGLTSWASPSSVQADKWGLLDEPEQVERMKWGSRLEPAIIAGLAEDMGVEVKPFGKLIRSRAHPFAQCTPDGEVWGGTFVQIKNSSQPSEWEENVPPHVFCQVQHEMLVSGGSFCMVAALLMGNRLVWKEVARSQPFIEEVLLPVEREFWRLTQAMEPWPATDASEHTKRALQILYPDDSGETVSLDGHFSDLDVERRELLGIKSTAEKRLAAIDNEFRAAIKDATYAALPSGCTYTLKTQHRKAYTAKASTFRVLRRQKGLS